MLFLIWILLIMSIRVGLFPAEFVRPALEDGPVRDRVLAMPRH